MTTLNVDLNGSFHFCPRALTDSDYQFVWVSKDEFLANRRIVRLHPDFAPDLIPAVDGVENTIIEHAKENIFFRPDLMAALNTIPGGAKLRSQLQATWMNVRNRSWAYLVHGGIVRQYSIPTSARDNYVLTQIARTVNAYSA